MRRAGWSPLTRIFGPDRLSLAEDVVQEALVKALQTWPYYGVPTNPSAWITQVAKHLALDVIRRERVFQNKEPELAGFLEQARPAADYFRASLQRTGIKSEQCFLSKRIRECEEQGRS